MAENEDVVQGIGKIHLHGCTFSRPLEMGVHHQVVRFSEGHAQVEIATISVEVRVGLILIADVRPYPGRDLETGASFLTIKNKVGFNVDGIGTAG